jgi:multiple sugar transport system ATP-binding protein
VFLLDEPLSSLDAVTRAQLRAEIGELQRETGVTTLYVTHDQSEAMTLGTRIAVMQAGRVQQIGTPSEVYERPANVFVAGFVGSPRMNLFAASLRKGGDGRFQISVGGVCVELETDRLRDPSRLDGLVGREVLVGVRPEGIAMVESSGGRPAAIAVSVRAVESLGADQLVYFEPSTGIVLRESGASSGMASRYMIARWSSRIAVRVGDRIEIEIDSRGIHVFDESGRAL